MGLSKLSRVILVVGLVAALFLMYAFWPDVLRQIVLWQKGLHQDLAQLLQDTKNGVQTAPWALFLVSLVYGVLHAAGPGHGKLIISSYLISHPTKTRQALGLTVGVALIQALVAVILVSLLLLLLETTSRQVTYTNTFLERGSYVLVMLMGLYLCLRQWRYKPANQIKVHAITERVASGQKQIFMRQIQQLHQDCGCHHVPDLNQYEQQKDWKTRLGLMLSVGLRPCSGAILVLVFAKMMQVYLIGILSVFAMAIGTAFTISCLSLLALAGRKHFLPKATSKTGWLSWIPVAGGLFLILSGASMLHYNFSIPSSPFLSR